MKLNFARANPGLWRLVWPFVVLILAQAFLAAISLNTLSSVRAYVGGEALWSRGQNDAIYYLNRYAETGDELIYQRYQQAIAMNVSRGD